MIFQVPQLTRTYLGLSRPSYLMVEVLSHSLRWSEVPNQISRGLLHMNFNSRWEWFYKLAQGHAAADGIDRVQLGNTTFRTKAVRYGGVGFANPLSLFTVLMVPVCTWFRPTYYQKFIYLIYNFSFRFFSLWYIAPPSIMFPSSPRHWIVIPCRLHSKIFLLISSLT